MHWRVPAFTLSHPPNHPENVPPGRSGDLCAFGKVGEITIRQMQRHAAIGDEMVQDSYVVAECAPVVRSHHERIDGQGYPDALVGSAIPKLARIVSVCDAFDAMASTRHYRDGMGIVRALAILREHSGSQWDPVVVEALVRVVDDGRDSEAIQHGALAEVDHEFTSVSCCCVDALPETVVHA